MIAARPRARSRRAKTASPETESSAPAVLTSVQEQTVLQAIEGEQQLLAQALHDTVCQSLTGMNILATLLARRIQGAEPELADEVAQLGKLIFEASEDVQAFVRWLRPPTVGTAGLRFALAELARETSKRVRCRVKTPAREVSLDAYAAAQVYYIAQGVVNCAIERKDVTQIAIALTAQKGSVTLTLRDNRTNSGGEPISSEGRFGWEVLQRRARVVGATLTSEPIRANGVQVTCTLPVHSRSTAEPAVADLSA